MDTRERDLLIDFILLVGQDWEQLGFLLSCSPKEVKKRFDQLQSYHLVKEKKYGRRFWTKEEDKLLLEMFGQFGNSWSLIAYRLKRTKKSVQRHLEYKLNDKKQAIFNR